MDYCGVAQIEGLFEMNGLTFRAALEKAGVEFLDDGQGVRLKPPKTTKGKRG
jgi:hypothetical protein